MTRSEHVKWCKKRALEYVDRGDVINAFSSMCSDLKKHEETVDHPAIELGVLQMMFGHLDDPEKMRDFIEGFN